MPTVTEQSAERIFILDCVDLGDSLLLSDTTGESYDDFENRVQRFHLRAELVPGPDGNWLVERAVPILSGPC